MPTQDQIRDQIEKLGDDVGRFGTWKEVRHLPGILQVGEEIKGLTSGFLNEKTWLILCTNRRLLFVDCGMFWGIQQLDIPLEKVSSFEYRAGLIFGEFTVWDSTKQFVIKNIRKGTLNPFANAINRELEQIRSRTRALNFLDVADQIRKLSRLVDDGILTESEFQNQKTKLLSL
jgi:hypothetical protein